MAGQPNCEECAAIARELVEAHVEARASLDPRMREAAAAFYEMIGGDEEDAARAEELLANARAGESAGDPQGLQQRPIEEFFGGAPLPYLRPHPRLSQALKRALVHRLRTGRWPRLSRP